MYLFSNKKTKISLECQDNTVTFELCPYDTISHLITVSKQYFPELGLNPLIYHQSKLLNEYDETMHISELTKGKTFLHLTTQLSSSSSSQSQSHRQSYNNVLSQFQCLCNDSTENIISLYCINCREFMCINCKSNHNTHRTFFFDVYAIEDSVKSSAISLQAEISNELNKYKEIEEMLKMKMVFDFNSWKKEVIKKLNQIEILFKSLKQFEALLNNHMLHIEKIALDASNNIEKKLNDYLSEKKKNNNIDQAKEVFKYFSNTNEVIEFLNKENNTRNEEYAGNKAINELLIELDNSLSEIEQLSKKNYFDIKKRLNLNQTTLIESLDTNSQSSSMTDQNTKILNIKGSDFRTNFIKRLHNRKNIVTPYTIKSTSYSKYCHLDFQNDLNKDYARRILTNKQRTQRKSEREHSLMLPNININ